MRLINITPQELEKFSLDELLELWKQLNFIWASENPAKEEFLEKSIFVINEFHRRKLQPEKTTLLKAVEEFKDERNQEERTEHRVRLKNPDDFDKNTFRTTAGGTIYGTKEVPATVNIIWGKLKGKADPADNPIPQALRFKTASWSADEARAWLKKNNINFISFEVAEQEAVQEAMRQPFGSPGGKRYMADRLVRMFPEHKTYVEVFAGGLACFWKKKMSEKEVVNDKNPDIIMAYRTIQGLTPEQWETLKKMDWKATESGFAKAKEGIKTSIGLQRFHDFIYLMQFSDVGEMIGYDNRDDQHVWAGVNNLMRMKERMKNVTICNMDYSEIIRRYDSPDTFFYIDPPYPSAKLTWKWMPETKEIEEVVSGIKGKWLLSYELTEAFGKFNKTRIKLWSKANVEDSRAGKIFKNEQLVCNYKIENNTRYLHESCIVSGSDWFNMFFEYFTDNGYTKHWAKLKEETKFFRINEAIDKLNFNPGNEKMRKEAIETLREGIMPTIEKVLIERFKKANIRESTRFALQHQWWKGVQEHWDLRITTSRKDYLHFELEYSPLSETEIVSSKKEFMAVDDAWMSKGIIIARINPGEIGNQNTDNPCWIEMLDRGKVIIEEESEAIIKLKFSGKILQGAWIAEKDLSSSDRWTLKREEQNSVQP